MKKIILSVAALSAALAQAQVGINQEVPKATLDISVKKDNIDNESQEGLLIPRVTKEKALKMANNSTTPPEESALIYVNDMTLTGTADATVEDITENGYYFWNGTKWVKSSGTNGELWAQRENNGVTETYLKPADANDDFVGYNSNRNFRLNLGEVTREQTNWFSSEGEAYGLAIGESPIEFYTSSDVLPLTTTLGNPSVWGNNFFFNRNIAILKEDHVGAATPVGPYKNEYIAGENYMVARDVTSEVRTIQASHNSADLFSNATVETLLGVMATTSVGSSDDTYNPMVANNTGMISTPRNFGSSGKMRGLWAAPFNYANADDIAAISSNASSQYVIEEGDAYPQHTVKKLRGIMNYSTLSENGTITGDHVFGIYTRAAAKEGATISNDKDLRGIYSTAALDGNVTANRVIGGYFDVASQSGVDLPELSAVYNRVRLMGTGNIEKVFGSRVSIRTEYDHVWTSPIASNIENLYLQYVGYNELGSNGNFQGNVTNAYDLYAEAGNDLPDSQITNRYGIYINGNKKINYLSGSLGINTDTPTEKLEVDGKIKTSSLAGVGDRMVVADENGILKIGGTTSAFTSLWVKDGADAKLAYPESNYITKYTADGGYSHYHKTDSTYPSIDNTNNDRRTIYTYDINDLAVYDKVLVNSSDLPQPILAGDDWMRRNFDVFKVDASIPSNVSSVMNDSKQTIISEKQIDIQDKSIYNTFYNVEHWGDTKAKDLIGNYSSAALNGTSSTAGRTIGGYFDAVSNSNANIGDLYASFHRIRLNGTGDINRVFGLRVGMRTRTPDFNVTSNIGKLYLQYVGYNDLGDASFQGTVGEAYDFYAESGDNLDKSKFTKRYGIYITGDDKVNYFSGKLGINTNNPSERLEVAGVVKAESFKGTNGATVFPDYVFEKYYTGESTVKADYSFKNLNQVEDFIKINGHLPGYISAKKVKEQGYVDIMKTQLTNVEKIEELYLHTIEQEKSLKAKDAKIEKLENELQAQKVYFENRLNKLEALLSK